MDVMAILNALVGAAGPVCLGAWVLSARLERLSTQVERLRADVDKSTESIDETRDQVGGLRERVAVLEAGCARCPTPAAPRG